MHSDMGQFTMGQLFGDWDRGEQKGFPIEGALGDLIDWDEILVDLLCWEAARP